MRYLVERALEAREKYSGKRPKHKCKCPPGDGLDYRNIAAILGSERCVCMDCGGLVYEPAKPKRRRKR